MRELSTLYHTKMSKEYDYTFFFVQYKPDLSVDLEEKGNYIYIKGVESFSGMFDKFRLALQYVRTKYEYDFILRANLSSFWNIPKLYELSSEFTEFYAGGIGMFNSFISGTGILLSRRVAEKLSECRNNSSQLDDVFISNQLKQFIPLSFWNNSLMYYKIDGTTTLPDDISNILYFRIRNPDRQVDLCIFRELLTRIYSIDPISVTTP